MDDPAKLLGQKGPYPFIGKDFLKILCVEYPC